MTDTSSESVFFLTSMQGLFYGIAGGILAEFVGWYKLRTVLYNSHPEYSKSLSYWIMTIGMIFAGGGLVYIYIESGFQFKALLAINIGATAPLILEAFTRQMPEVAPGKVN